MKKADVKKAEFDTLTMVDTCGAWWNQASNIPRDSLVFDALILLQFNCTLYKAIAEHKILSRQSCEVLIYIAFHSPASVVTVLGDSMAFKDILRFRAVKNVTREDMKTRLTSSAETLPHTDRPESASKIGKNALIDVRKEKCIGTGLGPILAPQPQVVAPNEALPARANIRIPVIIS